MPNVKMTSLMKSYTIYIHIYKCFTAAGCRQPSKSISWHLDRILACLGQWNIWLVATPSQHHTGLQFKIVGKKFVCIAFFFLQQNINVTPIGLFLRNYMLLKVLAGTDSFPPHVRPLSYI